MAKAIGRTGGAAMPIIAGTALAILMDQACTRLGGGVMLPASGGLWEECHFTDTNVIKWTYVPPNGRPADAPWFSDVSGMWAGYLSLNPPAACKRYINIVYEAAGVRYDIQNTAYCNGYPEGYITQYGAFLQGYTKNDVQHQADGWQVIDPAAGEAKLAGKLGEWAASEAAAGAFPAGNGSTAAVMDQLMQGGSTVDAALPVPQVDTPVYETPMNVVKSDPVTGVTTETTTVKNDYSCLVITGGNAVQCSQVKTTTQTSSNTPPGSTTSTPQGTVTTVTTPNSQEDQKDQCVKYPDSMGCAELGAVPTGVIPKSTASVTFAEENLFSAGSCPANLSATLGTLHTTVTVWDWSKTCALALPLRALVMSLALFAGFLIVMPTKVSV
jgi:hypothetical protein